MTRQSSHLAILLGHARLSDIGHCLTAMPGEAMTGRQHMGSSAGPWGLLAQPAEHHENFPYFCCGRREAHAW